MEEQVFQKQLKEKVAEIENIIQSYLPQESGYPKTVLEAMNYSVLAGGKRLRPMLMRETYRMFGGKEEVVEPFMAALEMIHTYSLVHDDLPAMDNDMYRRGRKTTWAVYGDGMGILAGDGLLNYAFETAMKAFPAWSESAAPDPMWPRVASALHILAKKAGVYGMIGGQTVDIESEKCEKTLDMDTLLYIHEHKTAALIQSAMMIGAVLAGAKDEQIEAVEKCAYNIGIAFQIQDDILDVTGDSAELGKMVGSDALNHKQTYVTIKGLDQSKEDVDKLSKEAVEIIRSFPGEHEFLEELVLHLIHRRK